MGKMEERVPGQEGEVGGKGGPGRALMLGLGSNKKEALGAAAKENLLLQNVSVCARTHTLMCVHASRLIAKDLKETGTSWGEGGHHKSVLT